MWLSSVPSLYLPFARVKYRSVPNRLVERDTELVIEGFQRSGNTFAVFAFEMAQDRPIKSAHHLHASAQFIRAVKLRVPVLLLVRDPRDAIVSHVIREPCANMAAALRAWTHFYERAIPVRDRIFVADFSRVSTDFGAVIRDFNEKFGTGYKEFHHTEANVARCFDKIEERNRQRYGRLVEGKVARPSEERRGRQGRADPAVRRPGGVVPARRTPTRCTGRWSPRGSRPDVSAERRPGRGARARQSDRHLPAHREDGRHDAAAHPAAQLPLLGDHGRPGARPPADGDARRLRARARGGALTAAADHGTHRLRAARAGAEALDLHLDGPQAEEPGAVAVQLRRCGPRAIATTTR